MRSAAVARFAFVLVSTMAFCQSFFDVVKSGTPAQVRAALEGGASAELPDADGATPLMYAAVFNRDPRVIMTLLAAGARAGDRDKEGHTALMWAARSSDSPAVVSALIKAGSGVGDRSSDGATALMLAAAYNVNVAVVTELLAAGAGVSDEDARGGTPLLYAAEGNQNPDVLRALLRAGARVDQRDGSGVSVLMHAASYSQNPDVISVLIDAGAPVDERDGAYNTPLIHAAARNMNTAVLSRLLAAGADVDARNAQGLTPILVAGQHNGNPAVITTLIRAGARIGDRDKGGDTALHYAAAANRNPEMIAALVEAGAKVDEPDARGRTALMVAATYTKTPETIGALLAAGADPRKKDHEGRTAFDLAGQNKSLDGTKARWDLDVTRSLARGLLIVQYRFYDIFPVFYGYYDKHPLGQVVIMNTLDAPVTDVRMSFFVKEFMGAPRECPIPSTLLPNEPATADLFAVFDPRILQVVENTKVEAEVRLEYVENGQRQSRVIRRTFPVLRRNALNWDDTRRAAAFVSPSDPAVLRFAKNVSSAVAARTSPALDPNLTMAMAMYDALRLLGVAYSLDPVPVLTPNRGIADFVQFPRQTLENRSGKCSDLSALTCALLEAVGVETAFVTVPGHIYVAVALGMSEPEAKRLFGHPEDLLFEHGKVWLPLEVTLRGEGFAAAWERGAQQWRENKAKGDAELFPLRLAWRTYEPVALPGAEVAIAPANAEELARLVREDTAAFVAREVPAREAAVRTETAAGRGSPRSLNDLGLLYARYGLWDQAEAHFASAAASGDYVPALVNLGNVSFAKGDFGKALGFYQRALSRNPSHPAALIGHARSSAAAGDAAAATSAYAKLKAVDPDLAGRLAYLERPGASQGRASDAARVRDIAWDEE